MKSFKVTLDRIEEGIAVLLLRDEESIKINIPLTLLPVGRTDLFSLSFTKDKGLLLT